MLRVETLTRANAEANVEEYLALVALADPNLNHPEYLLADETPEGVPLYGKWQRSFLVKDGDAPVAIALIHERLAETATLYDVNQLYIGAVAVKEANQHQGIGSLVARLIIDRTIDNPWSDAFNGPIEYVGSTNHKSNFRVMNLAAGFGFTMVGFSQRPSGIYNVMRARLDEVVLSPKYRQAPTLG